MTFGCNITDRDYLAAFAPEQPEEVRVGQTWMRVEDGQTLPVWRVRHDSPLKSGGPRIDLGHDRLVIGMGEEQLRREWVCTDPPENVSDIRAERRYEFLVRCEKGHEVKQIGTVGTQPIEGERCYRCPSPVVKWWFRKDGSKARWSSSSRFRT